MSTYNSQPGRTVFISYAREDYEFAERIYHELRRRGFSPWLDKKSLLPGEDWQSTIRNAIKSSSYILILISKSSVNKRGQFQVEIKQALSVYDEVPPGDIFIIPARLDKTTPRHDVLNTVQWVDLFPSFMDGVKLLTTALDREHATPP
jgi:hypothetical protein